MLAVADQVVEGVRPAKADRRGVGNLAAGESDRAVGADEVVKVGRVASGGAVNRRDVDGEIIHPVRFVFTTGAGVEAKPAGNGAVGDGQRGHNIGAAH